MKKNDYFESMAISIPDYIRAQMIIGILPLEKVEEILKPLLKRFKTLIKEFPLYIQYDLRSILYLYPELAEKYEIKFSFTISYFLFSIYKQLCNLLSIPDKNDSYLKCINYSKNKDFNNIFKRLRIKWNYFFFNLKEDIKDFLNDHVFDPESPFKIKKKVIIIGVPSFAFATLVFFIPCTFFNNQTDYLLSSQIMSNVEELIDLKILKEPGLINSESQLAFAASKVLNKSSFRLGFNIAGLDIMFKNENPQSGKRYIDQLNKNFIVRQFSNEKTKEILISLKASLNNNKINANVLNTLAKNLKIIVTSKGLIHNYEIGEWCATSKIIISSGNSDAILTALKYFNDLKPYTFDKLNKNKGIAEAIDKIIKIYGNGEITEQEINILKNRIERIITIMS